MSDLSLIFLLLASGWAWLDSISAREKALTLGSDLAKRYNLQMLDETVACNRVWLARNTHGHLLIQRTYAFEVSASGAERLSCQIVLLGKDLQTWYIPPYVQTIH